ncbi:hypothetical protein [Cohnella sp. WQ 127256]|uniref:hypothetical protein n=1 Tax=Cohnella sp. WQ 127256 TaxID=2938790 RepID=UPI0021197610|nr:hypothetical protein [Cohnella sp. WQ 127256]
MKIDFKQWDIGGKTIFLSTCLAILSLFFKWVSFAFFSENGFGQGGIIFLILFIYPVIKLLQDKPLNKMVGYICAGLGVICGIWYISSKTTDFLGTTINAASTGPYVFIAACVLLAFGIFKRQ